MIPHGGASDQGPSSLGCSVDRRVPDDTTITVDGRALTVTHPDRVLFADRGETKLDLIRYYEAVREPLLATMGDRPVMLQRFPRGAERRLLLPEARPEERAGWLETATVSTPNGTRSNAMVVADVAHVAWAVNLGCLGFHVWPSRATNVEIADELRIDLDPGTGVTFAMVQEAATEVRRLLDEDGVAAYPKTTGSRGIHIYARSGPRVRLVRRCAPPRSRSHGSWSAAVRS